MKKIIATIAIILGFGFGVNAQSKSDGFFSQSLLDYRDNDTELPRLPDHGLATNQNAPIGSGLFLLAAMGLAYGIKKNKKN